MALGHEWCCNGICNTSYYIRPISLSPGPTTLDIRGMMHPRGINAVCWTWGQAVTRLYKIILSRLARREGGPTGLKLQALTLDLGYNRMNIESEENMEVEQLKRIADAIEEILRLVKKDMEPKKK